MTLPRASCSRLFGPWTAGQGRVDGKMTGYYVQGYAACAAEVPDARREPAKDLVMAIV
jgi:hypothetical protein